MYRGLCSGCHGGSGRGGKGPNLTDDRWLHGDKDEDIARVIQNGVPRTTMKKLGESLTDAQIGKLIAYIRDLGRTTVESGWKPYMAGDPLMGQQLFFDYLLENLKRLRPGDIDPIHQKSRRTAYAQ